MHVIKCGASDYGSVRGEACREEGFHSKVGTINPELTQHNYSLIDREPPTNIDEYIKSLGVKRKIRADAVRCASIIVDYPKDEIRPPEEFFEDAKKGLQEHFGIKDDAILYARVHVDEGHDHMHFAFVPLLESEKAYKDGHTEKQVKLSAFDVLTKASLQELHPFMQKYMSERGYEGTLHYADGEKRDKEFLEHKIEKIEKEIQSLEEKRQDRQEEVDFWDKQSDLYMEKAISNRDEAFELEDKNKQLKEKIKGQEVTIASNSEALDQQEERLREGKEAIKKVDAITQIMADREREPIHIQNMTIPEKKSFFGKVEEPERKGVFVDDMDTKQLKALVQRASANEGLEKAFDGVQERCNAILRQAHQEAKEIKAEATTERNETVARAEQIISQEQGILARARAWAENLKKKYEELLQKVQDLTSRKDRLEREVAEIEAYKGNLEPLRQEVQELTRAKKILSGELDNELTQARFKTTWELREGRGFGNDIAFRLRDEGKLIALYTDGKQRIVGRNENGGLDNKTLDDEKKGLCRIGAFVEEERVRVPKSLLKELIQNRDRTKPISQNLENLISQQTEVERVRKTQHKVR